MMLIKNTKKHIQYIEYYEPISNYNFECTNKIIRIFLFQNRMPSLFDIY